MKPYETLEVTTAGAIATVTMDRPEVHNAFNDEVVAELSGAFEALARTRGVRAIVLAGAGRSFSAGADLNWMRSMVDAGPAENIRDAEALAQMFHRIDRSAVPVIARIQGPALGGGAGLAAVADIAVASEDASFAFSEARLGLIPAVISPYVVARIGAARAREVFLTAERFSAGRAAAIGLVARAVPPQQLDGEIDRVTGELLRSGPEAVAAAKELIFTVSGAADPASLTSTTARLIAERRASREGQEGMRAFLEKRRAPWIDGEESR